LLCDDVVVVALTVKRGRVMDVRRVFSVSSRRRLLHAVPLILEKNVSNPSVRMVHMSELCQSLLVIVMSWVSKTASFELSGSRS
jgi:hypothetical protein